MIDAINICSLIVAGMAMWIARDWRQKSTRHVFTLVQSCTSSPVSAEHPDGFHQFEIYVKNLGLPFPQMSIELGFRERDGKGWWSCPLRAIDISTGEASDVAENVSTGLVVKFGWRSYEMDLPTIRNVLGLEDLYEQDAVLSVYCAGYKAGAISLASWRERLTAQLQKAIHAFLRRWGFGFYAADQESWRAFISLPDWQLPSSSLAHFIDLLRENRDSNEPGGLSIAQP